MSQSIEEVLGTLYTEDLIVYIQANPHRMYDLLELAVIHKPPHSARAAWMLFKCMKKNDPSVLERFEDMLRIYPEVADGHQRNLLSVILKMQIPEDYEARVYDLCLETWCSMSKIPSVRIYALKVLVQLGTKYPEFYNEILCVTEDVYIESLTPGVRRSVMRLLSEYKRRING